MIELRDMTIHPPHVPCCVASLLLLTALLLPACSPLDTGATGEGDGSADMGPDDEAPVLRQQDTVFSDKAVWGEQVWQGEAVSVVLSDDLDEVMIQDASGKVVVVGEDNKAVVIDQDGALMGQQVRTAHKLGRESWLVGTDQPGVKRVLGSTVIPTPLDETLKAQSGEPLVGIKRPLGDEEGGVWFATKDALLRLEAGRLVPLSPGDGGSWAITQIEEAGGTGGVLWIVSEGALWHLKVGKEAGEWALEREAFMGGIVQIAPGDAGDVWALLEDGSVMHRQAIGVWTQLEAGQRVARILSHIGTPFVWALLEDGSPRLVHTRAWHKPAGLGTIGSHAVVTARGRVVGSEAGAVTRWYPGADVKIVGFPSGRKLQAAPVEVEALPVFSERVVGVKVVVDEAAVSMPGRGPWKVMLDPTELGQGEHKLRVEVDYGRGEPYFIQTTPFEVSSVAVGWKPHVERIYIRHCAQCHGQDVRAEDGRTALKSAADWQRQMTKILDTVEAGRMPPTPQKVSTDEIEVLKAWQGAGFP